MNSVFWQLHYHSTDVSRCRGGKVLLCRFPLFTSRHMKVVNTPADVMMQKLWELLKRSEDKRYLHWWMNTWRCMAFFTVCVLNGVCGSTWRRPRHSLFKVCRENLWNQTILRSSLRSSTVTLGGLLFSKVPRGGRLYLSSCCQRVHSCSSSSSWSSSMASIWVLEHTSLIGAESSPSTTSSLDISLFFCGDGNKNQGMLGSHWEKETRCCQKLQLMPLLC